jgi:hypothetical protein
MCSPKKPPRSPKTVVSKLGEEEEEEEAAASKGESKDDGKGSASAPELSSDAEGLSSGLLFSSAQSLVCSARSQKWSCIWEHSCVVLADHSNRCAGMESENKESGQESPPTSSSAKKKKKKKSKK